MVPKPHPVPVPQVRRHVAASSHGGGPKALHRPRPLILPLPMPMGRRASHVLPLRPALVLWRSGHVGRPCRVCAGWRASPRRRRRWLVERHVPASQTGCLSPCNNPSASACPARPGINSACGAAVWTPAFREIREANPVHVRFNGSVGLTQRPGKACREVPACPCAHPCLHKAQAVAHHSPGQASWAVLSQPTARQWELPKSPPSGKFQASLHNMYLVRPCIRLQTAYTTATALCSQHRVCQKNDCA